MESIKIGLLNYEQHFDLPIYETVGSAGLDVKAVSILRTYGGDNSYNEFNFGEQDYMLEPGDRVLVSTGLKVVVPEGYEIQVRPRSGLALKKGITVLNSPGTIDSDYRGIIGVILVNTSTEPFTIKRGDRIAQLVLSKVYQIEWSSVSEFVETERGEGGFGSTGQ